jgi:EpsI family protein
VLLLALACWPVAAHMLLAGGDARPVNIVPMAASGGWKEVSEPVSQWTPHVVAPAATHRQTFERDGKRVGIWLGFYRNQDERSKLATSYSRVDGLDHSQWRVLTTSIVAPDTTPLHVPLSGTLLQGRSKLLVWQWYWLGNKVTASLLRAKLDLAITRLTRRSDASAWVALYAVVDEEPAQARATLEAFMRDNAANLDAALRATAER